MKDQMKSTRRSRGLVGPSILILVGSLFLLERTGIIHREILWQWWPLLLIVIGGGLLLKRINRYMD